MPKTRPQNEAGKGRANRLGIHLPCPRCGERRSRVIDTRGMPEKNYIRRRRECEACGHRFTTFEGQTNDAELVRILRSRVAELEKQIAGIAKVLSMIPEENIDEQYAGASATE